MVHRGCTAGVEVETEAETVRKKLKCTTPKTSLQNHRTVCEPFRLRFRLTRHPYDFYVPRLAGIKIVVETRRNNPPCNWFRLFPPCPRSLYNFYENVRDFLAPCSFSKPSRIHSTANHFPSSKSSLFSLDCECTHRPLLLLLVIFGEKSSAMKKKKKKWYPRHPDHTK